MRIGKIVAAFAVVLASSAVAGTFTGPTSPYYLDDYNNRTIYVVQGTTVNSFAWAYSAVGPSCSIGALCELTMAVSSTVNTRPNSTPTTNEGGQYSLAGAPTGQRNPYPTPTGQTSEDSRDGTSDGTYNYYVAWNGSDNGDVYRTDLDWKNPVLLFTVSTTPGDSYLGIAYDPANNSLWISGWTVRTINDYSLKPGQIGTLLSSFNPGHLDSVGLGYDPADGTLWLGNVTAEQWEQWSTSGVLKQSGNLAGLPLPGNFYSGDFSITAPSAVPEPGSILLLATTLSAIALIRRRKRSPSPC
jgi:hypothetical protein